MKQVLFVNTCMREGSRTYELAETFLDVLKQEEAIQITEISIMNEPLECITYEESLKRSQLADQGIKDHSLTRYAAEFAGADMIVVAAPYWDLTFPAKLKIYFEHISVCGITFAYGENGEAIKLCKAEKVVYLTSAGGYIQNMNLGFDYVRGLFGTLFRIEDAICYSAEALDIAGMDEKEIMGKAKERIVQSVQANNW